MANSKAEWRLSLSDKLTKLSPQKNTQKESLRVKQKETADGSDNHNYLPQLQFFARCYHPTGGVLLFGSFISKLLVLSSTLSH